MSNAILIGVKGRRDGKGHFRKPQPEREVKLFPWTNSVIPAPWPTGYSRVMLPFTAEEARNATPGKTHHFLIVRNSRLRAS